MNFIFLLDVVAVIFVCVRVCYIGLCSKKDGGGGGAMRCTWTNRLDRA